MRPVQHVDVLLLVAVDDEEHFLETCRPEARDGQQGLDPVVLALQPPDHEEHDGRGRLRVAVLTSQPRVPPVVSGREHELEHKIDNHEKEIHRDAQPKIVDHR
ncbi:hypothetical protein EBZ70_12185 [bacterium]|nr:hypothetical protein [bacterium]